MQGSVRQTTILSVDPQRQVPIKGLDQASTKLNLANVEYTVEIVTTRKINNLTFSCVGGIPNGSELTKFPSTSEPLNIKYGPRQNASDVTVGCVNVIVAGSSAAVHLNASQIVDDPGNPTSTVMWKWENGTRISNQVSGKYEELLSIMVTRADNKQVITVLYDNTIGHTMQRFTLCVKFVPGPVNGLTCNRIAIGYNCSWNPPTDDGGEAVSTYCYGHITDQTADCPRNSSKCQLNPRTAKENALQQATSYAFYVYAVNSVGKGNCLTQTVKTATVLGPPLNVSVQPSRTSLGVKWSPPFMFDDGDDLKVREYYIEHQEQGSSMAPFQMSVMGNQMETDITDLKSNTTYLVRVFARTDIGNGSESSPVNVTTLRKGEVSQVQNVKATVLSTEIRVTWDEPDAGGAGFTIERYIVKVYRQGSIMSVEKTVEVDGSQKAVNITGLSESTTYRIEVSANNGQNTGAPSEGTLATTEKKSSSDRHHYSKPLCLLVSFSS